MPPALHTSKGVGRPPKLPLQPDPWTHPYPQLIQGARSPPWERARGLLACSCSHLLQQRLGPRPCLDFSAGLWSISIDWGRPRTLIVIRIKDARISLGLELQFTQQSKYSFIEHLTLGVSRALAAMDALAVSQIPSQNCTTILQSQKAEVLD